MSESEKIRAGVDILVQQLTQTTFPDRDAGLLCIEDFIAKFDELISAINYFTKSNYTDDTKRTMLRAQLRHRPAQEFGWGQGRIKTEGGYEGLQRALIAEYSGVGEERLYSIKR